MSQSREREEGACKLGRKWRNGREGWERGKRKKREKGRVTFSR